MTKEKNEKNINYIHYKYNNIMYPTTNFSLPKIVSLLILQKKRKIFITDIKKDNFAKIPFSKTAFSELIYNDFGKALIRVGKECRKDFFIGICRDFMIFSQNYKSWKYRSDIKAMRKAINEEEIIKILPIFKNVYKFIMKGYDKYLYPCHSKEDLEKLEKSNWTLPFRICTNHSTLQFLRNDEKGINTYDLRKEDVYSCSHWVRKIDSSEFIKKSIKGISEFGEEVIESYEYNKIKIIALILTANDRDINKTLESVKNQTRKLDEIIISSENENYCNNKTFINPYKKGLARNTMQSLSKILLEYGENVFIATIDDDDEWDKNYIKSVEEEIRKGANIIFTALQIFVDGLFYKNNRLENMNKDSFLYGNQGVQGSNKVFQLSVALEAGGIPKHINASTDRAFNTNLLHHPEANLSIINEPLVIFNQDTSRNRITNDISRLPFLREFYKTYWHMIDKTKINSINERHKKLHNFNEVIPWK